MKNAVAAELKRFFLFFIEVVIYFPRFFLNMTVFGVRFARGDCLLQALRRARRRVSGALKLKAFPLCRFFIYNTGKTRGNGYAF